MPCVTLQAFLVPVFQVYVSWCACRYEHTTCQHQRFLCSHDNDFISRLCQRPICCFQLRGQFCSVSVLMTMKIYTAHNRIKPLVCRDIFLLLPKLKQKWFSLLKLRHSWCLLVCSLYGSPSTCDTVCHIPYATTAVYKAKYHHSVHDCMLDIMLINVWAH